MSSTTTLARGTREPSTAAGTITACAGCGATLAPSGDCLAVGACADADRAATAGAARLTAKYAVPAAWNVRGGVD